MKKKKNHKITAMFQGYHMESEKMQGQMVFSMDAASLIQERSFLRTVDVNLSTLSGLKGMIT